ncbi:cell division ATP-binding protein FtsE [Rhodohalobacter sulfatireducens]|uniref:Cell division ATP-binding protein FtsE n=1 Tax=Rhodohalobacter sulfatireducens TaxID=2911366 RepID=A0ABS9KB63_9BACT|nr:cell division ATP-binding protein FtsE [Rhodohalobacter sulfatireducens]MCG2588099.1 cell division ATP-binding protein FtsE [Rhodohalobacter sulfatireducens]
MSNEVIQMTDVSVAYNGTPVLDSINFSLDVGEFCYVIGRTGAGKSSFLKLIYKDVNPTKGLVKVADFDLSNLADKKIPYLRRRLGVVFQDFQLLPDRNVFDNVAFALRVTGQKKRFIKQRVIEVLGLVGLSHKRKAMPDDLSGGEKQRVVIARALANEPRLLLADEPTGNLDPEASASIMELLHQINNRGMSVLMVTHDYEVIRKFPNRTVQIENGSLQDIKVL